MTLEEIRWISELFKTKKMSKAAETLYVSQPALSQCLQRVEKQLGFTLFNRSNKGLVPTEKGILFYQAAVTINETYDKFIAQAELLDLKELKNITIGIAPYISSCCSAEIVQTLCNLYPDIHFRAYEAYTPELIQALQNNTIQLMVTISPTHIEGMTAHPFESVPCVIFLRRGSRAAQYAYVENNRQYLDPTHLKEEPVCTTFTGQASRYLTDHLLAEAGITPKIVHESRHITSLYRYAQEGIATGISPLIRALEMQDNLMETKLIYRIPPSYRWSCTRLMIHTQAALDRIIPSNVYEITANSVMKSVSVL